MNKLVQIKIKDVKNREKFSFSEQFEGKSREKLELADDKNIIIYGDAHHPDSKLIHIYRGTGDDIVWVKRKIISLEKFRYIFAQDEDGKVNVEVLEGTPVEVISESFSKDKYVKIGELNTFAVSCLIAQYWAQEIRKELNSK